MELISLRVIGVIKVRQNLIDNFVKNPNLDPINNINDLYNIAIKDKEFCDLDNLITYCKDCHYQIHGYNL